jgi:hypothetical protein
MSINYEQFMLAAEPRRALSRAVRNITTVFPERRRFRELEDREQWRLRPHR